MGSLGAPAIPKSRGVGATTKRYVGHRGLDTNSRAHPGPSRTCAPFALTMSVRIFGHFLPFPIFLARQALCSAPPCTADAWTNGPHMVCSSCTLVHMCHTPSGRTEAPTHKELCQGVVWTILAFWHFWVPFCPSPCHGPWRSLGPKYVSAHIGLLLGPTPNVISGAWAPGYPQISGASYPGYSSGDIVGHMPQISADMAGACSKSSNL